MSEGEIFVKTAHFIAIVSMGKILDCFIGAIYTRKNKTRLTEDGS